MELGTLHTRRLVGDSASALSHLWDLRVAGPGPRGHGDALRRRQDRPGGAHATGSAARPEHWERYGYGTWVFRERPRGRFVGYCGLWNTRVPGKEEVELAYAVASGCWGEGFGTEMAREVAALGLGRLGLAELVAYTLPTNRASRRVMEKAGFGYERDIVHAGLPHVLYRLPAPHRGGTPRARRGRVRGEGRRRPRANPATKCVTRSGTESVA